ncbi:MULTISPECIES: pyruvate kinase [unclassified Solwaraspora]|uniref:pyruvate kinase n=1 Tax=unclassified Solwaraspora TaxID=2627926 RepID=UPI00248D3033|nr:MULTISPECIES: pyruvate kinase [unclassified Solwaraspora]WBB94866.1 pyruvate kinase [Solwaraspora sp. WMMA2059]WBC21250.1 pyruvate kinase [Solwaraspora sp. WMMA2080]WJK36668.1 pyruvate kinase [Solwaraspora sp. WMMA2065]
MGVTRRAKIVCTLGPATASPERIRGLVEAGMDVARLNFSHGSHEDHQQVYQLVREAAQASGRAVAVLADLQGPKIRLGRFADGPHEWRTGDSVVITSDDVLGSRERVSCTYRKLPQEVRPGDRLLIDDGKVAVEVSAVDGNDIRVLVVEGGPVSNNKGISLPNVAVSVPALSDKDTDDLRFALGLGADFIALSFVRSPEDIKLVHAIMDEEGVRRPVLAKVEKPEAVTHLEAIVDAFDGVMVARGDLGVELPLDEVPLVQKRAVQLCRENAKPVIVATQMLDSMIENSRPTRAEASDVANAVLDGTDAVMLSGETSVGKYPVLTVSTMAKIVTTTEHGSISVPRLQHDPRTHGGALTSAASQIARAIGAKAMVAFTQTGDTVRRLSRLQCELPLLAFTPVAEVRDQLALSWGVETFLMPFVQHTDDMFRQVDQALLGLGRANPGEYVVIVAGSPVGTPGSTNTLRVHQLGSLVDAAAARALQ